MIYKGEEGIFTCGSATWSCFVPEVMIYDSDFHSQAFYLDSFRRVLSVPLHPLAGQEYKARFLPLWKILSVSTMWVIWKSKYAKVFDNKSTPPAEAIKEIWSVIIHTVKGRYDNIFYHSKRDMFCKQWYQFQLFVMQNNALIWNYSPPR